jgi:hypothetical protein
MERYRFLALSLPFVAAAASAQGTSSLETESTWLAGFIYQYYLPFFVGLLILFLIFFALTRITRRRVGLIDFVATAFGIILGLVLSVTGFVFLAAASVIAWGDAIEDMSYMGAESWAVPIADEIHYDIQPFLDMIFGSFDYTPYLLNFLLGVLLVGGGILAVIGIVLIWKLPKGSLYGVIKPKREMFIREVSKRGMEPLAPTVTFKVIDRSTNQPSPDIKVVLKHKEGAKVYERYTDFNGEVVFQKIDGLYSQYYAYVEGDEGRKRYWVIRTAIGAESVT